MASDYARNLSGLPIEWELLLCVNGSTDRSLEVCQGLARRIDGFRVLEARESGWGRAVRSGLAEARGDLLCYTNSARTSGAELMMFLELGLANPRAVIKANRKLRDGWQRRVGSLLFNTECRALFDLFYWDINGTPKVFPRSFEKLLALTRDDDLIDVEFTIVCQEQGYLMLEVPVFSVRRHGGRSTTNYRSALRLYWTACRMWLDLRRVRSP